MTKKEAEYLVAQMKSYLDQQLAAIDRRGKIDVHEFEKRYMTVSNGGCPVDHSLFRRFLNECAMGYGAINISVTEALPLEPDSNTLYILQQENGDVSLNVYVDGEWVTVVCSIENIISILYADLCTLRSESKLIPGSYYRITDYNTTTTQPDTQSAGHAFDIIVKALNSNSLSEEAYATIHEDDTYFENAKLGAWELKYCLDNDTSRFAWADTINGKGVIYFMKDEWNNECPYDFKNIQFKKSDVFLYTFGGTTDNSLTGDCRHNTMMGYVLSSVLTLNFNTFGDGCVSNTFGNNCHSNTFGNNCHSNTFGDVCCSNTFGDWCYSNTFGDMCYSNTFGDWCYSNTFGESCDSNTFGESCDSNTFGDWCYSNIFGVNCSSNTFGNSCGSNTFGNYCYSNTFGNRCYSNTFGNDCLSNTFGKECRSNNFYHGTSGTTKKDYLQYIVLEDGVSNNNFYSNLTTSYSSYLQRIRIKGLENATPTDIQILLSEVNTKYEWVVAKNSDGVVQQYCIEDAPSDNKIYGRKDGDWEEIDTSGGGGSTIPITWSALKALRDAGTLVPEQSYRITDYITTTTQTNTQSAGNVFDIIVTALSTNELSENAKCVRKSGDTYFTNAKLEAWEIKYCIDNDTNRFAWADTENGKGVIYYMKDEWGNECPYDFKNIQFKKSNVFLYTFGGEIDNSLTGGCHHNTMMDYISSSVLRLNFNTFGVSCSSNTFGKNCHSNTFLGLCYSNTFGNNCYSNTFGNRCSFNRFGTDCNSNTFGDGCQSNTFGDSCRSNTFGDYCNYNTFGDYCNYNTFGNGCNSNTFGNYCRSNNFYHGTSGTIKKDYLRYIVLEDGVSNNNFYSNVETSSESPLQRIRIKGLENATPTDIQITLPEVNTKYEWLICYTSDGTLKQYCPNDDKQDKNKVITDVVVDNFISSSVYTEYPYEASIAIPGVLSTHLGEVTYNLVEALSNNFAPICETYDGGVKIFSKTNSTITIKTIIIFI